MDRGVLQAAVHGVSKESDKTQQLKQQQCHYNKWALKWSVDGLYITSNIVKRTKSLTRNVKNVRLLASRCLTHASLLCLTALQVSLDL